MMATILTPFDVNLAIADGELSFWKEILPESTIKYEGTKLDFNQQYFSDLICAFNDGALDQTPFMLADKDNEHTMDVERQRGNVTQMCEFKNLPADVKAKVAAEGKTSGLFGKITFPDAESARTVLKNPKLGVSARIRAGIERVDGPKFKRAIVHV